MGQGITYKAHRPDHTGFIHYSDAENRVWAQLVHRQKEVMPGRAADAYLKMHASLGLAEHRVPQLKEVSARLQGLTGWEVVPVPALIPMGVFLELLSNKKFPAASFVRDAAEFDYLEEPDLFHELFGHAPHLTDPRFAEFTVAYARKSLELGEAAWDVLARLYWLTIEFGLVREGDAVRAYGAGVCSSPGETVYAIESEIPLRKVFDPVEVLRTSYRIDRYQPVYFVLDSFDQLFDLASADFGRLMREAESLGDLPPRYPPKSQEAV